MGAGSARGAVQLNVVVLSLLEYLQRASRRQLALEDNGANVAIFPLTLSNDNLRVVSQRCTDSARVDVD